MLNPISDTKLNNIASKIDSTKVELIFISACHSSQMGEILKEKFKKAVIIAINK